MLSSCRGRRRCGSCVLAAREAFLQKMWLDTSSAQKSVASGVLSFNPVPMLAHTTSTAVTATAMVMDITFCSLPFLPTVMTRGRLSWACPRRTLTLLW